MQKDQRQIKVSSDFSGNDKHEVEFSFNASGWLQIFQMGVVYFFQRH